MAGIYVHIPFCVSKCAYCDFFSVRMTEVPFALYADRVLEELDERLGELQGDCRTIYIGGGTPSLLDEESLCRLSQGITARAGRPAEFTLEANPDDVTRRKAETWLSQGVDRVSLGIQSMVDPELAAIGRRHDAARVYKARDMLHGFRNLSADIIFGLPGQTPASLEYTLREVINLGFTHISAYNLMYEPGTILTHRLNKGLVTPAGDDMILEMFAIIRELTAAAGFRHYEISNYAFPGYESRHNSAYWSGEPYLGLGPGAHSYDGANVRRSNRADIKSYLEGRREISVEVLDAEELREEYLLTRLRTARGIGLSDYEGRFGADARMRLLALARPFIGKGWLRHDTDPGYIALTEDGVMMSDSIILALAD